MVSLTRKNGSDQSGVTFWETSNGDLQNDLKVEVLCYFEVNLVFSNGNPYFDFGFEKSVKFYIQ